MNRWLLVLAGAALAYLAVATLVFDRWYRIINGQ